MTGTRKVSAADAPIIASFSRRSTLLYPIISLYCSSVPVDFLRLAHIPCFLHLWKIYIVQINKVGPQVRYLE